MTEKSDLFSTDLQSNEIHENEVKISVKSSAISDSGVISVVRRKIRPAPAFLKGCSCLNALTGQSCL